MSVCRLSTKCNIVGMYEEYGWKTVDGKIVVDWGLPESSILENKHTTCGCRSGCNTKEDVHATMHHRNVLILADAQTV